MTIISRSASDVKVKISASDLRGDFLENKIIAGSGVTINKTIDGAGYEQLVVTTEPFEADQFGLHSLKCRVDAGGCHIKLEVSQLADHTLSPIRKVAC